MSSSIQLALILAASGAALGAAVSLGIFLLRSRRAKRRTKRREQLKVLGKREGMDLLGANVPSDVLDHAAYFRGASRAIELDDVLIGGDREGRAWLARRKVCGETHTVYGFDIRGDLNVRGLHLEPVAKRLHQPIWKNWLRIPAERGRVEIVMRWQSDPRRMVDELTRRSVDRWLHAVATACASGSKVSIGLEVHKDHAWIHATTPLEGVALNEFLRRAQEMRRQVLGEVTRRPATLGTPATRVTPEDAAREEAAREETRPVFAVPAAEGADTDREAETIQLSASDLLRESPDPRRGSAKRRAVNGDDFEIPEPEERVTLIRAR